MQQFQLEYNQMMQSLTSTYKNIFVIDPEEGTLVQMDDVENVKFFISAGNTIQEKLDVFVSCVVVKEYAEQAYAFCNFDTLKERMGEDRVISCELKSIVAGWFRAQFILVDDSDGSEGKYLFTTQIIDNQMREVEQQRKISRILSDEYNSVHIFDFKNNICKEIRTNEFLHTMYVLNSASGIQAVLEQSMRALCDKAYLDEMLAFIDFETLPARMKEKYSVSIVFLGMVHGFTKATFLEYERDNEGNLTKALFVTQIIDKERRREEELLKNSMTDELSGLYNRRAFDEELNRIKTEGMRRDMCFVSFDLNGLKEVNDSKGHSVGDELIRGTAKCLERCFGPYGKVFRIGGDEFAAIITAKKNQMNILAADLGEITSNWRSENIEGISISLGYVCAPEFPNATLEEILDKADERMYAAKEAYYGSRGVVHRGQKVAYCEFCDKCIKNI